MRRLTREFLGAVQFLTRIPLPQQWLGDIALAQAAPCESLRTVSLPNTTITSAQLVAAGPYAAPAPVGPPGGPVEPGA